MVDSISNLQSLILEIYPFVKKKIAQFEKVKALKNHTECIYSVLQRDGRFYFSVAVFPSGGKAFLNGGFKGR